MKTEMELTAVKFSEFNPKTDIWENYIDRLKFCFEANGIMMDSVKRANFFTVCGAEVFETFLALITPKKPSELSFLEIESILTKHYSPKPNEISICLINFILATRTQTKTHRSIQYNYKK